MTELMAYKGLNHLDHEIGYWLTKKGLKVDFVLYTKYGSPLPIEVKNSSNLHKSETKGMKAFMQEYEVRRGYIVCMVYRPQKIVQDYGDIIVLPLQEFLEGCGMAK